jgi:hypothetical protein
MDKTQIKIQALIEAALVGIVLASFTMTASVLAAVN